MSDSTQEEAHTGPIKTPKQLLLAVFFSFFVPVFAIIALVAYVVADNKPAGSPEVEKAALAGLSEQDRDRGVAERLRKVGMVEIRDANRALRGGEEVYKAQCAACHAAGVANAPKLGDEPAWAARLKTGFEALVASALKGKAAMPAQAGGDFDDTEIARAVAYMANSAGAKFAEPQPAAAAATAATDSAPAPAAPAAPTAAAPVAAPVAAAPVAAPVATPVAAPATTAVAAGGGEALYKQACAACHIAGVANAPKLGDKAAWAPRIQTGVPNLLQSVLKGKGAMPPKGGTSASEAEIKAAVDYMVSASK
jgi:cytochrome c5